MTERKFIRAVAQVSGKGRKAGLLFALVALAIASPQALAVAFWPQLGFASPQALSFASPQAPQSNSASGSVAIRPHVYGGGGVLGFGAVSQDLPHSTGVRRFPLSFP